ncbi:hypothetical protein [Aeoliella sp. SH292]|uniref:hypothetical protein n=1 Tax=Aeoliella sp. SH292 TaxID=3454464 RepID=UPI003F991530
MLLAALTACNQFYIVFFELVETLPHFVYGFLVPTLYYLSRLVLGIGYVVCLLIPREAKATLWVGIAAGLQLLGLLPFGGVILTSLSTLAAALCFWVVLHRLSHLLANDQLSKLKTHLFWIGTTALSVSLLSGVGIFVLDEKYVAMAAQFMSVVGGTCMTIAYIFFAWVVWQFGRQLRSH